MWPAGWLCAMAVMMALAMAVMMAMSQTVTPSGYAANASTSPQAAIPADQQHGRATSEETLQAELRQNPRSAPAHALLALVLTRRGDLAGATAQMRRAVALDPKQRDYRFHLAVLELRTGQPAAAIALLRGLDDRTALQADVVINLARAYLSSGNDRDLARRIDALTADEAGSPVFLRSLTGLLLAAHRPQLATRLWQRVCALQPDDASAYATLSQLWLVQSDPDKAAAALQQTPARDRGVIYQFALGKLALARGDAAGAARLLEEVTRTAPLNPAAWRDLIHARIVAHQDLQAHSDAEQAMRLFPADADFSYEAALTDYILGRNQPSLEELRAHLRRQPDDARAVLLQAVLLAGEGNHREAEAAFARRAALTRGCDPLRDYFQGTMYLRMHQADRAARHLQASLRCHPGFGLAEMRLAQAWLQSNQPQRALRPAIRATEVSPRLAETYYVLSEVRKRLGDSKGAAEAMKGFTALRRDEGGKNDRDLLRSNAPAAPAAETANTP